MEWITNLFRHRYLEWNEYLDRLDELKSAEQKELQEHKAELDKKTEIIFSS